MRSSLFRLAALEAAKTKADVTSTISIPQAIKRSPTDLLKALNSTVGVDKTAPHFAFIDDPTTIPTTANQKRLYFLAKELGKRAARELAQEWPTLFMFDRDHPRLPVFRPEKPLDPVEVEATTENLRNFIDNKEVTSATRLFERLQSGNIEVSPELQLDLFRLVAYYNGNDVPIADLEEWHGMRAFYDDGKAKWQESGIADLLFEGLPKTAETYSIMIAALGKYLTDVGKVRMRSLYKEMRDKEMEPCEEAYNALIVAGSPKEMLQYLGDMSTAGVAPSVRTFNACISCIAQHHTGEEAWSHIRNVLGEMNDLRIEPSLTTYSLMLETIVPGYAENDAKQVPQGALQLGVNALAEILVTLELSPKIDIVDTTDQNFFLNALRIATEANNDELVSRVEKVYTSRKNKVELNSLTTESVFYSRYLVFKASVLPLDELEKLYKELVPRTVGVTRQLTLALSGKLSKEQRWSFTKRVVMDAVAARFLADVMLCSSIRKLLLAQDTLKMSADEIGEYQAECTRIVDALVEFASFTSPQSKGLQIKLHHQALAECALLLIRTDQHERAWEMISWLLRDETRRGDDAMLTEAGFVGPTTLYDLFDAALDKGDWYNASQVIQLMALYHPKSNLDTMVTKIDTKCSLTPLQRRMLKNFVKLRQ